MSSTRAWRALLGLLLALGMGTGSLVTYALSVLAPFLREDLGLSRSRFGLLATAVLVVAAVAAPGLGRAVDRVGGRRVLVGLFVTFGLSMALMSISPAYAYLVIASAIGGAALAATNPVTNQLVAAHVLPGQQGWLMGIKQSGAQMSAVVAGIALPPIAVVLGWRGAFVALAVLVPVGVVLALWVLPVGAAGSTATSHRPSEIRGVERRYVRGLAVYGLLMAAGGVMVTIFLPLYAFEQFGASPQVAGLTAAGVGAVGFVARIGWGPVAETFERLTLPILVLAGLCLLAVALLWLAASAGFWLLWAGVVLFGMSGAAWNTAVMLAVVRAAGPRGAGHASGTVMRGAYAGGVMGPLGFGAIVDATGSYAIGWATSMALLTGAILTAWWLHRQPVAQATAVPPLDP